MNRVTPSPGRGIFLAFGARHVKGVAVSRWIAAVCFVIAGALVVAFGHWWGLVFFVAAALNGSLAYLVPRWNLLRDAPKNVERVRETLGRARRPSRAGDNRQRVVEPAVRTCGHHRANERAVLETVTLHDIVSGKLPEAIQLLTDSPQAWVLQFANVRPG